MPCIKRYARVLLGGALLGGAALVHAQPVTDTFQVLITISGTCNVLTTTDIDFGTQAPTTGSDSYNQTGSIGVQCTNGLDFHIGLDGGTTTGDVNDRAMLGLNNTRIPYSLSAISYGGSNWGNSSPSWYSGTGLGLGPSYEITIPVYARATLQGNELAGTYRDTVTATLTF